MLDQRSVHRPHPEGASGEWVCAKGSGERAKEDCTLSLTQNTAVFVTSPQEKENA